MKLLLPLALLALIGCNATDAGAVKRDAGALVKSATRAVTNGQVAVRVNAALAQRKGVDLSGLRVESEGGVVTLGGRVRTLKEKRIVIDTANGIRGVDKVVDKLRIAAK